MFNGPFSGTTQVSWHQKGKTNLDSTEARDSERHWHQLGHMQVCNQLQTDNNASTPPISTHYFSRAAVAIWQDTANDEPANNMPPPFLWQFSRQAKSSSAVFFSQQIWNRMCEDRSDSFSFLASNNAEGNLKRWPKQWPSFILSFSTLDSWRKGTLVPLHRLPGAFTSTPPVYYRLCKLCAIKNPLPTLTKTCETMCRNNQETCLCVFGNWVRPAGRCFRLHERLTQQSFVAHLLGRRRLNDHPGNWRCLQHIIQRR